MSHEESLEGSSGLSASGRLASASLLMDSQMIPNEIALLIFAYLSMKDLLSISQTCKHWNSISEDDSLWKPLYKARWRPFSELAATRKVRAAALADDVLGASAASSSSSSLSARRARAQRLRRRQANEAESDHEQIAGWRSWKNKYIARRNWLGGRVVWHTKLEVHARSEVESLNCVRFDNDKYVAGSTDGAVYVRAVDDGRPLQALRGHTQAVTCMQMQDDLLVTGSKDNTIKIWRGQAGAQECSRTLVGHRGAITCLQFVGHHLMTRSWDLTGRVWDMNTGQTIHTVTGNSSCHAMQIENNKLICGYADDYIKLWDLRTGKCHRHMYGHTNVVSALRFEDNTMASGSYDKTVKLWDLRVYQPVTTFSQHQADNDGDVMGSVNCAARISAVDLQGQRVVSASVNGAVKVWNAKLKQFAFELKGHDCAMKDVQFDDKKVVAADEEGAIQLWNFAEVMSY